MYGSTVLSSNTSAVPGMQLPVPLRGMALLRLQQTCITAPVPPSRSDLCAVAACTCAVFLSSLSERVAVTPRQP
jgi:hypothetical protein